MFGRLRGRPFRRAPLRAGLVILALAAIGGSIPAALASGDHVGKPDAAPKGPAKPNIVLILTDDQRADMLWGMPIVRKKLIAHGVKFTNAFVVNSLCCPSRASILTGNYSHTTGVYRNFSPDGGFQSFEDSSTVATWLHDAGYETALVGKYMNHYWNTKYVPPGWDYWRGLEITNRTPYYGYVQNIDGTLRLWEHRPRFYSTWVLKNQAVSFIRGAKGPLFLYFAPFAPHEPGTPAPGDEEAFPNLKRWRPPSYNERDVSDKPAWIARKPRYNQPNHLQELRRKQYQSLLAVDDAVNRILNALNDTGRLNNTMIVFMSDNGVQWGEHRLTIKGVPYEESTHVPLIVSYPQRIHRARTDDHLVLNIDLAPTFAALAGVHGQATEGRSFLPLFQAKPGPWRSDFLMEHLKKPEPPTYCAVHSQRYLYVAYATQELELYDLKKDPYEMHNVAHSKRYRSVRNHMHSRMLKLCDPPPPGFDPASIPS